METKHVNGIEVEANK